MRIRHRPTAWPLVLLALASCQSVSLAQSFEELFGDMVGQEAKVAATDKTAKTEAGPEGSADTRFVDALVFRKVKTLSDWNADPTDVTYLTYQYKKATRLRAEVIDKPLELTDPDLFNWPLTYMTGHDSFKLTGEERKNLRRYLLNGGALVADDCLPVHSGFGKSFISEMRHVLPEYEFKPILADTEPYNMLFNIAYQFGSTYNFQGNEGASAIVINNRVAVLWIPQDYGCGWEVSTPPSPSNPFGVGMHNLRDSERSGVYEASINFLLYFLTH